MDLPPPHADYPPDTPPNVATGPYLTYQDDLGGWAGSSASSSSSSSSAQFLQATLILFGMILVFSTLCYRWSAIQRLSLSCCRICCDEEEGKEERGEGGILGFDGGGEFCEEMGVKAHPRGRGMEIKGG